jgi:hypothetical protein
VEPEPENAQQKESVASSDLGRKERVASWMRVYFSGCLLFPIGMVINGVATHQYQPEGMIGSVVFVPIVIPLLPFGLASDFCNLLDHIFLYIDPHFGNGTKQILEFLTLPASFIIFLVHYELTSKAENRRTFMLLMVSLILLICGSLIGCVHQASQPIGMQ